MWAAPPTSFTHNNSLSTATPVDVRLPPQRCRVSFAFSRWPENCCRDTHVKVERRQNNVGVGGQVAVLAAFQSKVQQQQKLKPPSSSSPGVRLKGPSSNEKQGNQQDKAAKQEAKKGGGEDRRQLSGSDVLWALQRATAEKAKKHQQQRQKRCNANQEEEDEMRRAVEVDDDRSNTNAGPRWLCIQSDWGFRLEALEKRLEELLLTDV